MIIGQKAPHFSTKAVKEGRIIEGFSLDQYIGKYVVFFFYPLDFTFVCPTELHAFQDALSTFHAMNTEVVGCSVDSCYSHAAWLSTPVEKGGIQGVTYPLVADLTKQIARDYQVLHPEGIAYRGLFLLDKTGTVRHQVVNDLPLGRSIPEAIRMVQALQAFEAHGEVCPANWQAGKKGMIPTQEGLEKYIALTLPEESSLQFTSV